jgi:hypothetical protein
MSHELGLLYISLVTQRVEICVIHSKTTLQNRNFILEGGCMTLLVNASSLSATLNFDKIKHTASQFISV